MSRASIREVVWMCLFLFWITLAMKIGRALADIWRESVKIVKTKRRQLRQFLIRRRNLFILQTIAGVCTIMSTCYTFAAILANMERPDEEQRLNRARIYLSRDYPHATMASWLEMERFSDKIRKMAKNGVLIEGDLNLEPVGVKVSAPNFSSTEVIYLYNLLINKYKYSCKMS